MIELSALVTLSKVAAWAGGCCRNCRQRYGLYQQMQMYVPFPLCIVVQSFRGGDGSNKRVRSRISIASPRDGSNVPFSSVSASLRRGRGIGSRAGFSERIMRPNHFFWGALNA